MFSYYSITFWYPTFLLEVGRDPLGYLIAFNLGAILGMASWGRASETRLGRRGAVSMSAAMGVASVPLFLAGDSGGLLWPGAFLMGAMGAGIWGMAPSYLTERFPTEGAWCRTWAVIPCGRRCRVADPVCRRAIAGHRHDAHRSDASVYRRVRADRGGHDLDGTRNSRTSVRGVPIAGAFRRRLSSPAPPRRTEDAFSQDSRDRRDVVDIASRRSCWWCAGPVVSRDGSGRRRPAS